MADQEKSLATAPKAPEYRTPLIVNQDHYMTMIENQMAAHRIVMDEYQKTCVMNAISAIAAVMDKTGVSFGHADVEQGPITQILLTVAALKLNASATPREVYFQIRKTQKIIRDTKTLDPKDEKKVWKKVVEMGIEGDGNDALLRRFGVDVKRVANYWLIREGDDFTPPTYTGMTVKPPTWTPKGTGKVIVVVYPILKEGNIEEYHMAYREDVKANLMAHLSNNMMNETFGICPDRYHATPKQLEEIKKRKQEILDKAEEQSMQEVLDDRTLVDFISPAWREPQSREAMIIRKMRNNVVKKIPKDFDNALATQQYLEASTDPDEVTKDIGGDPVMTDLEDAGMPVIDVTPPAVPVVPPVVPAPATAKPATTQAKPVTPPKTHPQPQTPPPAEPPREITPDAEQPLPDCLNPAGF